MTLRARVEEQAALTKRMEDALRRLAESLVARKRAFDRLLSLNSFAAYVLFTVLIGGGFFLLYQSRVGDLVDAEREAAQARDRARERADELQRKLDARRAAAGAALSYYELVDDGDPRRILAAYPQLDHGALTPTERAVFDAAAQAARERIAGERADGGLEAYRQGDYASAADELSRAVARAGETERAAVLRYYLGLSQARLGDHADAAHTLELALAGRVEREGLADARYHFAAALEAIGETGRARAAFDRFADENPASPHAARARERAAALAE